MEVIPRNGVSKSQILASIRETGITINDVGYTHRVMSSWKVVSDSSLTYGGFELVSPPMKGARNIEDQITKICNAIKGLVRVDRSCGVHVHFEVLDKYHFRRRVDTRTTSGKIQALKNKPAKKFTANLLRNYAYFQPVIDALVSPSRRGNNYCNYIPDGARMTQEEIKRFSEDKENYAHLIYGMSGRYQVVNLSCLESYGTVEFRQHNGSTNARKILNWVKLMERMVTRSWDRKYEGRNCEDYNLTIDGMMDFLGFGKEGVRNYSRKRARSNGFSAISGAETQPVNTDNPDTETNEESASTASAENPPDFNNEMTSRLHDEIVLNSQNDEIVYRDLRNLLNRNNGFDFNAENVQRACSWLIASCLPIHDEADYNALNWQLIRSEIYEIMMTE